MLKQDFTLQYKTIHTQLLYIQRTYETLHTRPCNSQNHAMHQFNKMSSKTI